MTAQPLVRSHATRRRWLLALGAALVAACAHQDAVRSEAWPDGASEAAAAQRPIRLFVSFVWAQAPADCPATSNCRRVFQMVGSGTMVDDDRGDVRSVRARSEDYEAFAKLATDDAVLAVLRDGAECATDPDGPNDTVEVRVDTDPAVRGRLSGCTGAPHAALRAAVAQLRWRYFAR